MRALALFSGGLDSMLVVKLMEMQGIEVIAIHMNIGFGSRKDVSEVMKRRAQKAGGRFEIVDVREEYIKNILFNPKHGYGKHFNPCIDCHGFMFRKAKELLKEFDANFIVTGEVLGQRPMSQRMDALQNVNKLAQDEDKLILRPLCAKLMPETTPELEGWVRRDELLDISGRGRERQLAMAEEFGFDDYESPGGGCLLTIEAFSDKIKDFIKYDKFDVEDINLLKFGRHLRLPNNSKLVIGRNQEDNEELLKIKSSKFDFMKLNDIKGPVALISKNASLEDKNLAVRLVLTYAKTNKDEEYEVNINEESFTQKPLQSKEETRQYFVVK